MFSFKSIVLIATAFVIGTESSAVAVPAAAPAALVAPAQLSYAHAVPQNIPPYASQVNLFARNLSPFVAAPFAAPLAAPIAAPLAAPAPFAAPYEAAYAPYAAPFAARFAAPAPYIAGPGPVLPAAAPYAAPYAAYPYAPAAPLLRSPYGVAPAFVR